MTPLSVLIVDDDAGDRKLLRRLLMRSLPKAQVSEAADAVSAESYGSEAPDLIFLDHMLPGATGLDVLETLKGLWPKAAFVVMTGQGSEDIAKSAIQSGANDYVAKNSLSESGVRQIVTASIKIARANWHAEEQQRDLQSFCDVLVHDFRAPIRAANFLADEIIEDVQAQDMDGIMRNAELLKRSCSQMANLVGSLSAHICADRGEVRLEKLPLSAVASKALFALQTDISDAQAQIEDETGEILVMCEPPSLSQVLQNLVANALKYSGSRRPVIRLYAEDHSDYTQISVSDNGLGVPVEHATSIFEPFKRLPSSRSVPGTGLGLATCHRVVSRLNGRIWCAPNPGEGTTFHLSIPKLNSAKMASNGMGINLKP